MIPLLLVERLILALLSKCYIILVMASSHVRMSPIKYFSHALHTSFLQTTIFFHRFEINYINFTPFLLD